MTRSLVLLAAASVVVAIALAAPALGGRGDDSAQATTQATAKAPGLGTRVATLQRQVASLRRQVRKLRRARRVGPTGPTGPIGPTGPTGATGPQGPPGVSGYEVVVDANTLLAAESSKSFTSTCPAGTTLVGGGAATFNSKIQYMASTPLLQGTETVWITTVRTFDGQPVGVNSSVNVRLICATVTG